MATDETIVLTHIKDKTELLPFLQKKTLDVHTIRIELWSLPLTRLRVLCHEILDGIVTDFKYPLYGLNVINADIVSSRLFQTDQVGHRHTEKQYFH